MRKYFYEILARYISLYIRPEDKVVEINPISSMLSHHFKKMKFWLTRSANGCEHSLTNGIESGITCDYSVIRDERPEYFLINGSFHWENDIQNCLEELHSMCENSTRLIVVYYSTLWKPLLQLAALLRLRTKTLEQNWITHEDMANFLLLSDFQLVKIDSKILIPIYIPLISSFVNKYLSPLPLFRIFNMVNILVARPVMKFDNSCKKAALKPSVSIIVPARNECGNIENIVRRIPQMGGSDEIVFIEGHSTDGTWEKIEYVKEKYKYIHNIQIAKQDGSGKGDAVRKGFHLAANDILMILDADLTVSPEDLPKFYKAIVNDKGEFINGSRLVYPMEREAMRFLNIIGNKFFATAFSFVLGQKYKDTLCGTKVISKENYLRLAKHRTYFGEFDPFGDFDLIFGAARLGLKITELPIVYKQRTYGSTNIQRWKHGFLLLTMLVYAARKIKFI